MPAIHVDDLVVTYGSVRAVDGLSFRVERGEIYALLGPNGAGKTTTVETLEGHRRALRDRVGVVLQSGGLDPDLTVAELARLYASFYARPRDVAATIEQTGLTGKWRARPSRICWTPSVSAVTPPNADRTHRELRLLRHADLPHHDHVQRGGQRHGDLECDRHAAARQPQHHDGLTAQERERSGQAPAGVDPVGEAHCPPPRDPLSSGGPLRREADAPVHAGTLSIPTRTFNATRLRRAAGAGAFRQYSGAHPARGESGHTGSDRGHRRTAAGPAVS
jgi:hypothetical protein